MNAYRACQVLLLILLGIGDVGKLGYSRYTEVSAL